MSVRAIAIDAVTWLTPCSMGLRLKLARDGLMPQRAAKMLGMIKSETLQLSQPSQP